MNRRIHLLLLLFFLTCPLRGQLRFTLATDKGIYAPGDSIHVTITAHNNGPVPDTLNFSTSCQASYRIDTLDFMHHDSIQIMCMMAFTHRFIQPYDSTQWTFCDFSGRRLGAGRHGVVGLVANLPDGWQSDTLWITVESPSGVGIGPLLPSMLTLRQNYPNPFNPVTTIEFALPAPLSLRLQIVNLLGEVVSTVAEGEFQPGLHRASWDGTHNAGGVYFYRLRAGGMEMTRKLLLLR